MLFTEQLDNDNLIVLSITDESLRRKAKGPLKW